MVVIQCGLVFGGERMSVTMPVRDGKIANVTQRTLLWVTPCRTFQGQLNEYRVQIEICSF